MRLKLLYEQILTYEQFIQQPNWEDILYYNYINGHNPFTAVDRDAAAINTINNDADHFGSKYAPAYYLELSLPQNTHIFNKLLQSIVLKSKNPWYAYNYAWGVIKGRWPEAEEIIMHTPDTAYGYALYVINNRWPEAEEIIRQDPIFWTGYCKRFLDVNRVNYLGDLQQMG